MLSLVTRFHLLIFGITLAIAGVAIFHLPPNYAFPMHWGVGAADWLWPRDMALAIAPALQAFALLAFFLLGRMLTKNHFAKTQHILEPALTLVLSVGAACQLGFLLIGIGSDFDMFRIAAFGLAAVFLVLAVVIYEAERHSYAGLRMPWPIASDRAWRIVHRTVGLSCASVAIVLGWLGWRDPGPGVLAIGFAVSLAFLPLIAAIMTMGTRHLK